MRKAEVGTPFILDDECYTVSPTYSPNNMSVEIHRDSEIWIMTSLVCENAEFTYAYIPRVGYILPINKLLIKES